MSMVPAQREATQRVATVRGLLERSKGQIALALPRHMSPDRLLRVAMTAIQRNPMLLECTDVSLVAGIIQAAQLGLEVDGRQAALIPRQNRRKGVTEANFQPMYQGLMDLARRSKEIAVFEAREVYQGDDFRYAFGLRQLLVHVPKGEPDEAKITHVYAVAHSMNGRAQFEVMTRAQIEAHRKKYSQDTRDDSAWRTAWPAMAKKTVIIRLCKYLPQSPELVEALAAAEEPDRPMGGEVLVFGEGTSGNGTAEPAALDALADRLESKPDAPSGDEPPSGERATVMSLVDELYAKAGLTEIEWAALCREHAGVEPAGLASVDVAALRDLVTALQNRIKAGKRGR